MATIVRKEYRKPYILTEGGYQDMMRATWDRSIWNDILEIDPVWAEFLFTRSELPDAATAAEIRYLRYIKQSEFKKYYLSGLDYEEMEYLWTGPIPGVFPQMPDDFGYDFPWRPDEGSGVYNPGEEPPFLAICDAETDGCYCPGQSKEITITATLPITDVESAHNEGEEFSGHTGLGTNSLNVTITSPASRSGQMRLRVFMVSPSGQICDSSINIYPCDPEDCCPECDLTWDFVSSTQTIVAPGSGSVFILGGTPPFSWSISSEDDLWTLSASETSDRSNAVSAAAGACGSATIVVTDFCGCTTEGSVRNPANGSWVEICNDTDGDPQAGCCQIMGAPTEGCSGGPGWDCLSIQGKYRQLQGIDNNGVNIQATVNGGSQEEADTACEEERSSGLRIATCAGRCDSLCTGGTMVWDECTECLQPDPTTMTAPFVVCSFGVTLDYEYQGNLTLITDACCDIDPGFRARYAYSCFCITQLRVEEWKC